MVQHRERDILHALKGSLCLDNFEDFFFHITVRIKIFPAVIIQI